MIKTFLEPLIKGEHNPQSLFITGFVGTGKSTVIKSMLYNLPKQTLARYVQVDAKISLHGLSRKIALSFFDDIPTYARFWGEVIDALIDKIGKQPALLVLDELEKTETSEFSPILHNLSRRGTITLLLLSRKPTALNGIPEDTRSSLKCKEFAFPPYNKEQLIQILNQRIEFGLYPNSVEADATEKIAEYASHFGNARLAIDILRTAADLTDIMGSPKLTVKYAEEAITEEEANAVEEAITGLPTSHRLLLMAVRSVGQLQPCTYNLAFRQWQRLLEQKTLPKFSIWKFYDTVNDLKRMDFIITEKSGRGRGRGFVFTLGLPYSVKEILTQMRDT